MAIAHCGHRIVLNGRDISAYVTSFAISASVGAVTTFRLEGYVPHEGLSMHTDGTVTLEFVGGLRVERHEDDLPTRAMTLREDA